MRSIFALFSVLFLVNANAQDTTAGRFTDVYLLTGHYNEQYVGASLEEWRTIIPDSRILEVDLNDLDSGSDPVYGNSRGYDGGLIGTSFSFGGAVRLGKRASPSPRMIQKLRFGTTYLGRSTVSQHWRDRVVGPYDTLTSSQTGEHFFIDTVRTTTYGASASFSRVGLDVLYVVERITQSRWRFQVGGGILAGMLLGGTGQAEVYRTRQIVGLSYSTDDPYGVEYYQHIAREEFSIPDRIYWGVQAMIGVDHALGRSHPFWSNVLLHYELRPVLMVGAQIDGTTLSPSIHNLLGLRFALN
jgi:hypothetical protein